MEIWVGEDLGCLDSCVREEGKMELLIFLPNGISSSQVTALSSTVPPLMYAIAPLSDYHGNKRAGNCGQDGPGVA